MSARALLVDLESVQPVPDDLMAWMTETGSVWVFHGPHQIKMLPRYSALGERVTIVPISRPGKNSLDFHLVFYLGYLTARNPDAKFAVLSKDTGYDPAIVHAQTLAFDMLRIEDLGATSEVSARPAKPAKKSVPVKKAATKPPAASKKAAQDKTANPAKKTPVAGKKIVAKKAVTPPRAVSVPAKTVATVKAAKSSPRTVGAIYRNVLRGLREQIANRPGSLDALERHVQTQFGPEPSPDKVRAVVDRLFTMEAVRQVGRRLAYFPNESTALTTSVGAAPSAGTLAHQ